jgi:hypothetical protein
MTATTPSHCLQPANFETVDGETHHLWSTHHLPLEIASTSSGMILAQIKSELIDSMQSPDIG